MLTTRATTIDRIHFYYHCPTCGEKHWHGSSDDLGNRTEIRLGYCKAIGQNRMISIVIDDSTIRRPLTPRERRRAGLPPS